MVQQKKETTWINADFSKMFNNDFGTVFKKALNKINPAFEVVERELDIEMAKPTKK